MLLNKSFLWIHTYVCKSRLCLWYIMKLVYCISFCGNYLKSFEEYSFLYFWIFDDISNNSMNLYSSKLLYLKCWILALYLLNKILFEFKIEFLHLNRIWITFIWSCFSCFSSFMNHDVIIHFLEFNNVCVWFFFTKDFFIFLLML